MPTLSAALVGMRYRPPALTILSGLGMDQPLVLRREPDNPYDENAIAVDLPEGWAEENKDTAEAALAEAESLDLALSPAPMLGYIVREEAAAWAPIIDQMVKEGQSLPPARLTFSASGSPMVTLDLGKALDGESMGDET